MYDNLKKLVKSGFGPGVNWVPGKQPRNAPNPSADAYTHYINRYNPWYTGQGPNEDALDDALRWGGRVAGATGLLAGAAAGGIAAGPALGVKALGLSKVPGLAAKYGWPLARESGKQALKNMRWMLPRAAGWEALHSAGRLGYDYYHHEPSSGAFPLKQRMMEEAHRGATGTATTTALAGLLGPAKPVAARVIPASIQQAAARYLGAPLQAAYSRLPPTGQALIAPTSIAGLYAAHNALAPNSFENDLEADLGEHIPVYSYNAPPPEFSWRQNVRSDWHPDPIVPSNVRSDWHPDPIVPSAAIGQGIGRMLANFYRPKNTGQ